MASRVSYDINISDVFDRAFSDKSKAIRSTLKQHLDDGSLKREFARRVREEIIDRTKNKSIDKNGDRFAPYSPNYKKSHDFQVAGKSSKVTLKLSGAMLASFRERISGENISFRFVDQKNNDKAHGHINGTDKLPVRDFFGLPEEVENSILRKLVTERAQGKASSSLADIVQGFQLGLQVGRQITGITGG